MRRHSQRLEAAVLALFVSALVLASAAQGASAFAFAWPAGWLPLSGSTGTWVDPSGRQYVRFYPTRFAGGQTAFVNYIIHREKSANPSERIWHNTTYPLCGHHVGRYIIWTVARHGKTSVGEEVMAVWGRDAYVASYLRPASLPPSSNARDALVSVCGARASAQSWGDWGQAQPAAAPAAQSRPAPVSGNAPAQPSDEATPYVYPSIAPRYAPFIPPK